MRQEIKFCADVYRLLFDHVDQERPCYLCLDGAATENGVREELLTDLSMSDFHWQFRGARSPFSMEAKIVRDGRISFCGDGQPRLWHNGANLAYTPVLWLGASESPPMVYYLWEHAGFDQALRGLVGRGRTRTGKKKTLKLDIPTTAHTFERLTDLIKNILMYAKQHRYYPNGHDLA